MEVAIMKPNEPETSRGLDLKTKIRRVHKDLVPALEKFGEYSAK